MTQWTVDKGLLKYVNIREQAVLSRLANALAEHYTHHDSWRALSSNPQVLFRLARAAAREDDAESALPPPHARPPRRSPPPGTAFPGAHPPPEYGPQRLRPRPRPTDGPPPPRVKFAVYDAEERFVAGSPTLSIQDSRRLPIVLQTSHGQTVGWLVYRPPGNLSEDFDLALAEELTKGFLSVSALALILSVALAAPLSFLLVRRIKALKKATRKVTRGDFAQRVTTSSKDELGDLARDFNTLAQTLEENEHMRKRWIADISHELRTPLAIASGELEAIQDGVREATRENVQSAFDEIQHLSRLIDDLYELTNADIGALRYQKEAVDINALVLNEVSAYQQRAEAVNLSLSLRLSKQQCIAWVDPHRIKQLVHNLLNNSLKYTDSPGDIEIHTRCTNDYVVLIVEDSSPGVDAEHLGRLFDPLYRVESSRNRRTGGSGLGLGICERIVQGHKGTITASNAQLGGLCIEVHLPLNAR